MSVLAKSNLRLHINNAINLETKELQPPSTDSEETSSDPASGSLTPTGGFSQNLQTLAPRILPATPEPLLATTIADKYLLLNRLDGSTLRRCVNIHTQEEFVCKVVPNDRYEEVLAGHFRLDAHPCINAVQEVVVGRSCAYAIFARCYGDLHSYVRARRSLREREAAPLFRQVARAVAACHQAGIVLRDLKLRKFVFKHKERTLIKLETLDDAVVLEEDDDWLNDKHGCPAYVSPEILSPAANYSGFAADCWSLGVMLYTMLVGRYPFHDTEPSGLFSKIRRGCYTLPDHLSSKAKCLIRSLLRMDPSERLTAEEVLEHPWFKSPKSTYEQPGPTDQMVPDSELRLDEACPLFV